MKRVSSYISSILAKNPSNQFYDREMLEKMIIKLCETSGKTSKLIIELPLQKVWLNSSGILHGGAISTLIDQATTISIAALDDRNTVSCDLSVSFLAALKNVESFVIEAHCHKAGKSLSFTSASILSNNQIIASGKHTKYMLESKWIA